MPDTTPVSQGRHRTKLLASMNLRAVVAFGTVTYVSMPAGAGRTRGAGLEAPGAVGQFQPRDPCGRFVSYDAVSEAIALSAEFSRYEHEPQRAPTAPFDLDAPEWPELLEALDAEWEADPVWQAVVAEAALLEVAEGQIAD